MKLFINLNCKKALLIVGVIVFFSPFTYGQIVISSCEAPDSIKEKYINDADRMALRYIYRNSLPDIYNPHIPQQYSGPILEALLAVYNADALPQSDSVTSLLELHTSPSLDSYYYQLSYQLDVFSVTTDSSLGWMHQLENGNPTCGHPVIDTLITRYGLSVQKFSSYSDVKKVTFKTDTNYNIPYIIEGIDTIKGVRYVQKHFYGHETNNIWVIYYSSAGIIKLLYSHGWGDCWNGCLYRRYWEFNVYRQNCAVEFVKSYGDKLYPTSRIDELNSTDIIIFPNPVFGYFQVKGINNEFAYQVFSITGQQVMNGYSKNQEIIKTKGLSPGSYFIRVQTANQVLIRRFIMR